MSLRRIHTYIDIVVFVQGDACTTSYVKPQHIMYIVPVHAFGVRVLLQNLYTQAHTTALSMSYMYM